MDSHRRPERVYLRVRRGGGVIVRVLDLIEVDGRHFAVVTWVMRDGKLAPGSSIELNGQLLKPAAPTGCWSYPEVVPDPLEFRKGHP